MRQGKIIDSAGTERWYKDDILHREDGPAVIYKDGTEYWYKDGMRHCEDGPGILDRNGDKWWYKDGRRHREDGPALIRINGEKRHYLNDILIKEKDYLKVQNCPIDELPLYINTKLAPIVKRRFENGI